MKARSNPYGQALTYDEWLEAQAISNRPLTDPHMHLRRAQLDARHSRLVEPIPRTRNAINTAEHRARRREDAA